MSFSKTISVFAALASIFGAGAAGWKLSQESKVPDNQNIQTKYEERITELQQQVSTLQQQATNVNPPTPVVLPQTQPQVQPQITPTPPQLPPTPVPPSPQPPTP